MPIKYITSFVSTISVDNILHLSVASNRVLQKKNQKKSCWGEKFTFDTLAAVST